MTRQVSTKAVTLASVVRDPAFRQGFKDRRDGKPPAYDKEWQGNRHKSPIDKAWAYERGRLFAAYCQGQGIELDQESTVKEYLTVQAEGKRQVKRSVTSGLGPRASGLGPGAQGAGRRAQGAGRRAQGAGHKRKGFEAFPLVLYL